MTVQQLITKLQALPQDAEVIATQRSSPYEFQYELQPLSGAEFLKQAPYEGKVNPEAWSDVVILVVD